MLFTKAGAKQESSARQRKRQRRGAHASHAAISCTPQARGTTSLCTHLGAASVTGSEAACTPKELMYTGTLIKIWTVRQTQGAWYPRTWNRAA